MRISASGNNNLEVLVIDDQELLSGQLRQLGLAPKAMSGESLTQHNELPACRQLVIIVCSDPPSTAALTRQIRVLRREAGVIVAAQDLTVEGEIHYLAAGADRCLALPCDILLVEASLNAMIRRLLSDWSPYADGVHLSRGDCVVRIGSRVFEFRRTEYRLCEYLIVNRGRWVSERELLRNVLDIRHDRETSLARVHIRHIRSALGDLRECLVSKRGRGYQFCVPYVAPLGTAPRNTPLDATRSERFPPLSKDVSVTTS